ncbi:MAG: PQQ-binding-like beta-propeller repeat protein, partial [bacterium]
LLKVKINPASNMDEGYFDVDVSLQHPFKSFNMYRGFDVKGIFLSDGSVAVESTPGLLRTAPDEARVLNPDGYTRWWNAKEFGPENFIFGFQKGKAAFNYYPTATLNPYKYFADDLNATDGVETLFTENRGTFGTNPGLNTRNYVIQFPMVGGKPDLHFQYSIDACWTPPDDSYAPEYPLEAFDESAQMQEPYHMTMWDDGSTVYYKDAGDFGGQFKLAIEVFDWQTPPTGSSSELSALYLESLVLSDAIDVLPLAIENPGSQPTSRIYSVVLDDLMLTHSGDEELLITAVSSEGTYEPDLPGGAPGFIFPDGPLAAFKLATVNIQSNSPNHSPVAIADNTTPLTGYAPLTVHLDPTGSYDPDEPSDHIVSYEWDIDNDGIYEYENSDGAVVDHLFTDPGNYEIQLRVTDTFNAWDVLDIPIEVEILEGEDTWPIGFYDAQNTCYNPNSHVTPPLKLVYQTNHPGTNHTQLVIGRGNIYLTDANGYIRCLDKNNGGQIWNQLIHTSGSFWTGMSPALWNDHIIIGGTGMHSFNADDGTQDWAVYTSQSFDHQGQVIVGDKIYVKSTSNSYVSINASDGSQNWYVGFSTFPLMTTAYGEVAGTGYVVAPFSYSEKCLRADNGSEVWDQPCGTYAYGNVIVIGEYAYFGGFTLYKKHLATGTNAASYSLGSYQPLGMCISDQDIFLVVRYYDGTNSFFKLMSFDFDLNFNWETVTGPSNEHPAYTDGYVWLIQGSTSTNQRLCAFDASDGSLVYTDSTPMDFAWGGISNVDNKLYLADNQSHLFVFEHDG